MKKVLIVTYYWPPAGGAGVQRVLKFAKYLPKFGWQPIILTVSKPDAPAYDETLQTDIPIECKVYKTKSLEPFSLYKKLTGKDDSYKIPGDVLVKNKNLSFIEKLSKWIRLNLFIPDAKIGWMPSAIKEAKNIINEEKIDIIFSTSPPPTTALIAKKIAKISKLKWVADFRDPWMEIVYYQNVERSSLTKYIDSKFEKTVLNRADVLLTISRDMVNLFTTKVGNKNYKIIPNGFDETDFQPIEKKVNHNFTIAYTGAITNTRVPTVFLKALKKFIDSENIQNIKLIFAGKTCPEFDEQIKLLELESFFDFKGFLPHNESTMILQNADLLILAIDNVPHNKGFLTGKIFEYLGAKTPIFAIGPIDGDANKIITETNSGKMVDYTEEEGAYQLLKKMYSNWQSNNIEFTFEVEKYSRIKQAEELSKIFNETI